MLCIVFFLLVEICSVLLFKHFFASAEWFVLFLSFLFFFVIFRDFIDERTDSKLYGPQN